MSAPIDLKAIDADVEFRIFQDDEFCSGSTVRTDAEHYAAVYGQDGPVERQTSISFAFSGFLSDEAIEQVKSAAQGALALTARIAALEALVGRFVAHDDDAKNNPVGGLSLGGLSDARDNTGVVYQSQALADDLAKARALQTMEPNQ